MSDAFSNYISNADTELRELLSSNNIREDEKRTYVDAFISSLYSASFSGDSYTPFKKTITVASAKFIDSEFAQVMNKSELTKDDVDYVSSISIRQVTNLEYLSKNRISVPLLKVNQPEVFARNIGIRYNNQLLLEKAERVDGQISRMLSDNKSVRGKTINLSNMSEEDVSSLRSLLSSYDAVIAECRDNGVELKSLIIKETSAIWKAINDYSAEKEKQTELYSRIESCDSYIKAQELTNDYRSSIDELINKCDELEGLIKQCKSNKWELKTLYCKKPAENRVKYRHYKEMMQTDNELAVLMSGDKTQMNKQVVVLCEKQIDYIKTCRSRRWKVPCLVIEKPEAVKANYQMAESQALKRRKSIIVLSVFGGLAVVALFAVIAVSVVYSLTHTKFPFAVEHALGQDYNDIVDQLEDAGYSNVNAVPSVQGFQAPGTVLEIDIDGVSRIVSGQNYRNDSDITVYYSSLDRSNATQYLVNWENGNYMYLFNNFGKLGCHVLLIELYSTSIENNNKIESVEINGVQYTDGDCYLPEGSEVSIYVYGLAVSIYDDSSSIVGTNYIEVYNTLIGSGFDNITLVRDDDLITGWVSEESTVSSITINGYGFEEDDEFSHNDEVVIHVHTFSNRDYSYIDD